MTSWGIMGNDIAGDRPPICIYKKIKNCQFGNSSNGISPIPNFVKIGPSILVLLYA
jgi:hypothetical protein